MSADAEKYKLLASLKILRHHLEIWRIDPEDDRNPLETNEPRIEREELKQTLWVEWIGISFAESWPSKAHPQRKPLKESRSPRAPSRIVFDKFAQDPSPFLSSASIVSGISTSILQTYQIFCRYSR